MSRNDGESIDWVLVQQVERDICLLYHQLANYSSIMGDLYYGSVYALPYWDFLKIEVNDPEKSLFIHDGCLVMLLAMAWGMIDGSGAFLSGKIDRCLLLLQRFEPQNASTEKLVETVRLALQLIQQQEQQGSNDQTRELERRLTPLSDWVHRHYVRGYFQARANQFAANPYYGERSAERGDPSGQELDQDPYLS